MDDVTQMTQVKRKMPPKLSKTSESKLIRLFVSAEWLHRVNLWRRQQEDFPTLSEAIRRIVDEALTKPKAKR
ncbi:MAG TPA: hypothetical protein VGJ20_28815 [Xanthobacteraceae bacterium]|jgi:hypothetical protein